MSENEVPLGVARWVALNAAANGLCDGEPEAKIRNDLKAAGANEAEIETLIGLRKRK